MNNLIEEDTKQYNTWICEGTNWKAKIPIDEFNSHFSPLMQAEEVATRIIEQFNGQSRDILCEFSTEEKVAELGGVILVYLENTDPKNGFLLMVHELLANAGLYKESIKVQKLTEEVLNEHFESEKNNNKLLKKEKSKKEKKKASKTTRKPPKPKKKK